MAGLPKHAQRIIDAFIENGIETPPRDEMRPVRPTQCSKAVELSEATKTEVSNFVLAARQSLNMSQAKLAAMVGVSRSRIAAMEQRAITHASLNTLDRIARVSGNRLRLVLGD